MKLDHPLTVLIALVALAAMIGGTTFAAQTPERQDGDRIEALEKRVASLEGELAKVKETSAQAAPAALLQEVLEYLQAQADSAKALEKTFDESEQKGFTYGINPQSREILLAGFRTHAAVLQEKVPGKSKQKTAQKH